MNVFLLLLLFQFKKTNMNSIMFNFSYNNTLNGTYHKLPIVSFHNKTIFFPNLFLYQQWKF